jgi:lipopolysaccharide transport system ATP-binding protein
LLGRVSALLEVGTGFHPELTGRENIFLNGAILGMRRTEIKARFEEIVDFAEVEKFLDTPVKRYSSGMYVRLAFAVAAHLEPEVLIVDEVLAVGDMAFQKKCLGRIRQVASGEGRTVLFVSHNMDAVLNLCTHTVVMEGGRASGRLTPMEGVTRYLTAGGDESAPLIERPRIQHSPRPNAFNRLTIRRADGSVDNIIPAGEGASFEVEVLNLEDTHGVICAVAITDDRGQRVTTLASHFNSSLTIGGVPSVTVRCDVPSLPLTPGTYFIDLILSNDQHTLERVERAGKIEIVYADYLRTGKLPTYKQGHVILRSDWKIV